MKEATIIAISAIQVACPECGGLCKSLSNYESDFIRQMDEAPFITMAHEKSKVECLRCGQEFALPRLAFVTVDLSQ